MTALRALLAVMAVAFAGTAGLFAVLAVRRLAERRRLAGWRRVDAVMTKADLERRDDGAARLSVGYRFQLGEQALEGSGLEDALGGFVPGQRAEALQRRFAPGTAVTVWVHPADAARSVLDSGMVPAPTLLLLASLVFLVVTGAFAAVVARLG